MEMKASLQLQMRQKLVMTPKLQQALKLLQMPALELQQVLKLEMMQNPLLEEEDELREEGEGDEAAPASGDEDEIFDKAQEKSEEEKAPAEDIDWDEFFPDPYEHAHNYVEKPPEEPHEERRGRPARRRGEVPRGLHGHGAVGEPHGPARRLPVREVDVDAAAAARCGELGVGAVDVSGRPHAQLLPVADVGEDGAVRPDDDADERVDLGDLAHEM